MPTFIRQTLTYIITPQVAHYYAHYFTRESFEYAQIVSKYLVTAHNNHLINRDLQDYSQSKHGLMEDHLVRLLTAICGNMAAVDLVGMYHGPEGIRWLDSARKYHS